ncbi:MAG TPA: adenosylcobinamide-phosphate synthase CbiB [Ruminiclostridium sp.]|nr:adenosylcobinamide-phosphate synthase CbiB [Ruminiclostridium sp.]
MEILIAVAAGFILDLILGDPHWLPHPVRLMGFVISKGESVIRRLLPRTPKGELAGGAVLAVLVTVLSFISPLGILYLAGRLSIYLKIAVHAFFCYEIMATKSLRKESMRVYYQLEKNDMVGARKYLSWIVGRDTQNLGTEGIIKATVETIAENASDGVIAPLVYLVIGGAPLGFLYKAINTMDSMIGYKNDRYFYFGRFAARLDDAANFIPAEISARFMLAASRLTGLDYKNAWKIYKRDRKNHSSPNSAKTESVCAGALNVQLAGDAFYFGKLVKKKTIGDGNRKVKTDDILLTNRLMYTAAIIAAVVLCGIRLILTAASAM